MDDDLPAIDTSGYGDADTVLYTFKVWDHRTEGEIYINKRDLELVRADAEESYGRTQGDATLKGAVYGLFALRRSRGQSWEMTGIYRPRRGGPGRKIFTTAPPSPRRPTALGQSPIRITWG